MEKCAINGVNVIKTQKTKEPKPRRVNNAFFSKRSHSHFDQGCYIICDLRFSWLCLVHTISIIGYAIFWYAYSGRNSALTHHIKIQLTKELPNVKIILTIIVGVLQVYTFIIEQTSIESRLIFGCKFRQTTEKSKEGEKKIARFQTLRNVQNC